ncbi:MAG: hypothetical protein US68_C0032G0005 [Candidatus Shapirobacteria bacterium GW2011_GWE1_38_10]|uniref:Uncharacterized protein n=1 Tax=Candidatus Shapirobacteria bacterium GW2011_GWE1_38_10 TaxID=1618488 RepID=A0A0G0KH04_9BACT|nr:MAG: hypothetical protein US68_C0032G0005 [Candidatus Shapirobacteria bacterium GW2011_GWE1_38_10]
MKKLITATIILIGIVILGVLETPSIKAQSVIPLIVAPARQTLLADPGQVKTFAVRFYNTGLDPISGTFKVADFIVNNNSGSPIFLEGPTTLSTRFAAANWVSLNSEKGTISGNGTTTVNGSIKIPKDANPGGKYFAVFFEPATDIPEANESKQGQAASVSMRIAGLVYLRVGGPISESATVSRFNGPKFLEYGPISITTEIKNNGDYHITPTGQIIIKNMFGKEIAKNDLTEINIFPNASRTTVTKLGTKWMVGRFTAVLGASYGESGKTLASSFAFWVFPWKLALMITLAIIIIILIVIIITNKFTKKEKKLEEELIQEKDELEKLKERYQDMLNPNSDVKSTPDSDTQKE